MGVRTHTFCHNLVHCVPWRVALVCADMLEMTLGLSRRHAGFVERANDRSKNEAIDWNKHPYREGKVSKTQKQDRSRQPQGDMREKRKESQIYARGVCGERISRCVDVSSSRETTNDEETTVSDTEMHRTRKYWTNLSTCSDHRRRKRVEISPFALSSRWRPTLRTNESTSTNSCAVTFLTHIYICCLAWRESQLQQITVWAHFRCVRVSLPHPIAELTIQQPYHLVGSIVLENRRWLPVNNAWRSSSLHRLPPSRQVHRFQNTTRWPIQR